jgi:hypothetical protein
MVVAPASWIFYKLVIYDDIFVFDIGKLIAIFEEQVGVVSETFTFLHGHPCEVVIIAGRL